MAVRLNENEAVCSMLFSLLFTLSPSSLPILLPFATMTTYVLYSPNGAIDEFFNSNTTVTRQSRETLLVCYGLQALASRKFGIVFVKNKPS